MTDQAKAYLCALAAVLCWSTVASAFKLSLRHMEPVQLLFYANLVSLLFLGAVLAARGKLGRVFACSRRAYLQSLVLGLLNPFLYYLILFKAYDLLPAQEAQPLNYTWAITLTLLSIPLLKQKIGIAEIAAGLVSYSGVLVIATRGDLLALEFSNPFGVALALLSTIVWALYWIFSARDPRGPVEGLFLSFLLALPLTGGTCLLFSDPVVTSVHGLLGAAYVGLFEMGIAFMLWLSAMKLSVNTARIGNLIFISPFLSLVFIHYLVGEEILHSTYVGLVLIVAGLLLQQLKTRHAN